MIKFWLSTVIFMTLNCIKVACLEPQTDPLSDLLYRLQAIEQLYTEYNTERLHRSRQTKERQINELGTICDNILQQIGQLNICLVCSLYSGVSTHPNDTFNPNTPVSSVTNMWLAYKRSPGIHEWNAFWSVLSRAEATYSNRHPESWMANRLSTLSNLLNNEHHFFCLLNTHNVQTSQAHQPYPQHLISHTEEVHPATAPTPMVAIITQQTEPNRSPVIPPRLEGELQPNPQDVISQQNNTEPAIQPNLPQAIAIPAPRSKQVSVEKKTQAQATSQEPRESDLIKATKAEIAAMHQMIAPTITILKALKTSLSKMNNPKDKDWADQTRLDIQTKIDLLQKFNARRLGKYTHEQLQEHLVEGQAILEDADKKTQEINHNFDQIHAQLNKSKAKAKTKTQPSKTSTAAPTIPVTDISEEVAKATELAHQLKAAQEALNKQYEEVDALLLETKQTLGKGGQKYRSELKESMELPKVKADTLAPAALKKHLELLKKSLNQIQDASRKATTHIAVLNGQKETIAKRKAKEEKEKESEKKAALFLNIDFIARLKVSIQKLVAMKPTSSEVRPNFDAFQRLIQALASNIETSNSTEAQVVITRLCTLLGSEDWKARLVDEMTSIYALAPHNRPENTFYHEDKGVVRPVPLILLAPPEKQDFLKLYMTCLIRETHTTLPTLSKNLYLINESLKESQEQLLKSRSEVKSLLEGIQQRGQELKAIAMKNKSLYEELEISVGEGRAVDIEFQEEAFKRDIALVMEALTSMDNERIAEQKKAIQENLHAFSRNQKRLIETQKTLLHMQKLQPCAKFLKSYLEISKDLAAHPNFVVLKNLCTNLCTLQDIIYRKKGGIAEKALEISQSLERNNMQQTWQTLTNAYMARAKVEIARLQEKAEACGEAVYNASKEAQDLTLTFRRQFEAIDAAMSQEKDEKQIAQLQQQKADLKKEQERRAVIVTTESNDQIPLVEQAIKYIQLQKECEVYVEALQNEQFQAEWEELIAMLPQALTEIIKSYSPAATPSVPASIAKKK